MAGERAEPDDQLRQNRPTVAPIRPALNRHRLAGTIVFEMNGRIGLAEKPTNRIVPIPTLEVAFRLAPELQHLGDLLERQVEATLAERTQPLFDFGERGLGGEFQGVVDCQTHTMNCSRLGGQSMSNLTQVVHQLQSQARSKQEEVEKLSLAINALSGVSGSTASLTVRKKPHFSAAAKARIAAAQRLRWRKLKAAQKSGK